MDNISQYVPPCYKEVRELKTIYDVETYQLDKAQKDLYQVFFNYFVQFCDLPTIIEWEQTLKLSPLPNESLEVRRQRVLFALSMTPPFTDKFLHELLDRYVEDYEIQIDSVNCELTISIVENNISLIRFLKQLLIGIIPAHFSFKVVVGTIYDIEQNVYYGTATSMATIINVGL